MVMRINKLNLVFHKIANDVNELNNCYDYVFDDAINLIKKIKYIAEINNVGLNIFLDDGYRSQFEFAMILSKKFRLNVYISLIADCVDKNEYLSRKEINILKNSGIKFCSHSFSHVALGRYENNVVLTTPTGGEYKDFPRGHDNLLCKESVKFQIRESFIKLKNLNIKVESFVYPYGIYNEIIKRVVQDSCLYDKAYTCDNGIEDKRSDIFAISRFMIYNDISTKKLISSIESFLK
jgi:hypothetical protein